MRATLCATHMSSLKCLDMWTHVCIFESLQLEASYERDLQYGVKECPVSFFYR